MEKLTVKLTVTDYAALIAYLLRASARSEQLPLNLQTVDAILYREYLKRNANWATNWSGRMGNRFYKIKLPLAMVMTLWRSMPMVPLTDFEQGVLNILDQAIVNYRRPHEPVQIGYIIQAGLSQA